MKKLKRRIASFCMVAVMLMGLLPVTASAEELTAEEIVRNEKYRRELSIEKGYSNREIIRFSLEDIDGDGTEDLIITRKLSKVTEGFDAWSSSIMTYKDGKMVYGSDGDKLFYCKETGYYRYQDYYPNRELDNPDGTKEFVAEYYVSEISETFEALGSPRMIYKQDMEGNYVTFDDSEDGLGECTAEEIAQYEEWIATYLPTSVQAEGKIDATEENIEKYLPISNEVEPDTEEDTEADVEEPGTEEDTEADVEEPGTEEDTEVEEPETEKPSSGAPSPEIDEIVTPPFVESEHTLPNGEEVRMVTVEGNRNIYVIGNPDYIPAGATFRSETLTSGTIYDAAVKAVANKYQTPANFVVFEMNLWNESYQPIHQLGGYINVTLPIPAGITLDETETIRAYRLETNGKLTKLDTAVANGQVTFATNHFSTYILVEENAMMSPKTGDTVGFIPMIVMSIAMAVSITMIKKKTV